MKKIFRVLSSFLVGFIVVEISEVFCWVKIIVVIFVFLVVFDSPKAEIVELKIVSVIFVVEVGGISVVILFSVVALFGVDEPETVDSSDVLFSCEVLFVVSFVFE